MKHSGIRRSARPMRAARRAIVAAGLAGFAAVALAATPPAALAAGSTARAAASCPWVNSQLPVAQRVADVLGQMSVSDEITLVEGHGSSNPYVFFEPAIPRLCIPQLGLEDGPGGVADGLTGVTQLPAGVALAATFSPSLARQYGQVIGDEELGKGAAVNLGPTVNIDRDPRWGRSFEAFTEDPFLNESMAVNEIDGVQSQGEMSQVKHYAAYNQETNRNTPQDDVIAAIRTLHEIYLPTFQAAIEKADSASIMCAYSSVNGPFSCGSQYLLTSVLRDQWDFAGFNTSDYGATHNLNDAVAGTDMEQPENSFFGDPLQTAVTSGAIARSVLNTMVTRILTEMFRFNIIDHPPTGTTSSTVTTPAHVAVATSVADRSATLLRNVRSTLPLSADHAGTVAVIGPSASPSPTDGGGGSAAVIASDPVTPLAGLEAAAGHGTDLVYQQGLPADSALPAIPSSNLSPAYAPTGFGGSYSGTLTAPETGTYVLAISNPCGCYTATTLSLGGTPLIVDPGTPPVSVYSAAVDLQAGTTYALSISGASGTLTWGTPSALAPGIAQAVAAAKAAATAVVVVSDDTETEAADRLGLDLPSAQNELVSAVTAANPHTVVVVDAGAPVAMPWLSQAGAVLDAWYPGEVNGTSLARLLFGRANPSGHLPVTFPTGLAQVPASTPAQFPGVNGSVSYSEGIDVGYRWYDAQHETPLFPFGYGLSYTRFTFSNLQVGPAPPSGVGDVPVTATVTNTGSRAGTDVAQLYLGDPGATGEPPRQLAGFTRVSLAAGASKQVTFSVTPRDTWWWQESADGWTQSPGTYQVYVGDSSALTDLPLRGSFALATTSSARQVVVLAGHTLVPGRPASVTVRLTASGTATLHRVRLALQLPQGWLATAAGPTVFHDVAPSAAPATRFTVTPPSWAHNANAVVHATATLGPDAVRENGVTVTVN